MAELRSQHGEDDVANEPSDTWVERRRWSVACGATRRGCGWAPCHLTCTARPRAASTSTTSMTARPSGASGSPGWIGRDLGVRRSNVSTSRASPPTPWRSPPTLAFRRLRPSASPPGSATALAIAATFPDRVTAVATGGGGRPFGPGMAAWDALSDGVKVGVELVDTDDLEAGNDCSLRPTDRPLTRSNSTTTNPGGVCWYGRACRQASAR